jgi:hypothetical protein
VPPGLERLILSLLAKRPQDRPANAGELASALAGLDAPPWTEAEAAVWWRALALT